MDTPIEFRKVLTHIHQDVFHFCTSIEEIAAYSLEYVDRSEAPVVRSFLDEMTSGRHSAEELMVFWINSPAQVWIKNGDQVASFLKLLRSKLDERWPPAAL